MTPPLDRRPPRLARWLLRLRPLGTRRAEVTADLDEIFAERAAAEGAGRAGRRYYRDVLSLWRWNLSGRRLAADAVQDLSHGLRVFRRNPGAVAIAVLGLSLAIAVSTSVFGLLNATMLRPTGVADPDTAVRVMQAFKDGISTAWPYAEYQTIRDQGRMLVEASLADGARFSTSPAGPADDIGESVAVTFVDEGYLRLFATGARYGRILQPADDAPGAPAVVVASYGFWSRRLGADASVIGREIWLNGVPATVVGVTQRSFGDLSVQPPAFWAPFAAYHLLYGGSRLTRASTRSVDVYGRIPAGVTRAQAETSLGSVAVVAAAETSGRRVAVTGVRLDPAGSRFSGREGTQLALVATIVLAIVGLVVLLGCVNVANLQLASALSRQREIGVRLALGAARTRIVRQLVTESLALGLAAGAIALLLTIWLVPMLTALVSLPNTVDVTPDARVYLFLSLSSIAAGIGAGLAPARYGTRGDLLTPLKGEAPRTGSRRPGRMRAMLIGVQAAASVVLLVLAALLTRATISAARVDVGFDPQPLLAIASTAGWKDDEAGRAKAGAYWDVALERLRALPNVRAASLTLYPPFSGVFAATDIDRNGARYRIYTHETSADYFSTLGLHMVRGRGYSAAEVRAGARVAVVSETLARELWPDQDPLGQTLKLLNDPAEIVVGVAADALTTQLRTPIAAALYRPLRSVTAARIIVRAAGAPEAAVPAVRDTLQPLDPRARVEIALVASRLRNEVVEPRIAATLAGGLAALALGLAIVGIYGVTAFVTGRRAREIGVRIAVGASRGDVLRLLLWDSLRPVSIGLAAGAGLALVGSQLLAGILFGVGTRDPLAFAGALGVLLVSAAAAVFVPARRAASVDPAFVLRQE